MNPRKLVFFKLTIFVILFASNSQAKNWRLQELARGSNALVVEMDQLLAHKKTFCKLDTMGLSLASQNLKALIDARVFEIKDQKEHKNQILQLMKTCKKDCTCDTYEYALEKMTGSEKYSTLIKFNANERRSCAKNFPGFCKSELFKALK